MPSPPILPLPDSEETIAFRAIDSILRSDPDMQRVFKTIVSWTGDSKDGEPAPASWCPYLMLIPGGRPSGWVTEGQHFEPMQIGIMIAVVGSDSNQLMNAWGLVRRTLFPQDLVKQNAVRTKVTQAGITNGEITSPAYGLQASNDKDSGGVLMVATGTLELYLMVNT